MDKATRLARRRDARRRLGRDRDIAKLGPIAREVRLGEAIALAADLLAGKARGRFVVDVRR